MSDTVVSAATAEQDLKTSWEIRKLQAEVDALRRPFKNPSVIAALTTTSLVALVSVGGLLVQWSNSTREYTLAQIKAAKLELDAALLEKQRSQLEAEVSARRVELAEVRKQLDQAADVLKSTEASTAQLRAVQGHLTVAAARLEDATRPILGAVVEMSVSPGTIVRGETATLSWSSAGATNVSISPDIGRVAARGSFKVSPPITTTYEIVGVKPGGETVSGHATVTVTQPSVVPARSQRDQPAESKSRH